MELLEVTLTVQDLDRQQAFYADRLGLPLLAVGANRLAVAIGRSRLTFTIDPSASASVYHLAFDVPEHQFDAAEAWLTARAPLLADPNGRRLFHFADWQADAIYVADPSGTILELIARHTRPHPTSAPFSAAGLLSISEVGLVVDDVPETVAAMGQALGVTPYYGQGPTFTALGDDRGLLIVVERGRPWYPDLTQPAVPLPLTVTLLDSAGQPRRLVGPPYRVAP